MSDPEFKVERLLRTLNEDLRPTDTLQRNCVGNLTVWRDGGVIGYLAFGGCDPGVFEPWYESEDDDATH